MSQADDFIKSWHATTRTVSVKHHAQLFDSQVRIGHAGKKTDYKFPDGSIARVQGRGKYHHLYTIEDAGSTVEPGWED